MEIIGYRSDAIWVADLLAPRLLADLDAHLRTRRPPGLSAGDSAAWARSFVLGYLDEVRRRLADAATRARHDHEQAPTERTAGGRTTSVAVALRSRAEAVEGAFRRRHPRTTRSTSRTTRFSSGAADAGRTAGSSAPLARHEVRGHRALGPGT